MHFRRIGQRLTILTFTCLMAFSLPAVPAEVVGTIERSFPVTGQTLLFIGNDNGSTNVTSLSTTLVRITAVKKVLHARNAKEARRLGEQVRIFIRRSGNKIEVEARYPNHKPGFIGNEPEVRVQFDITAPRTSDIHARSENGPLSVSGFEGRINLVTGDADLYVNHCSGTLEAHSGDGRIRLTDVHGQASAQSGDGKMTLDGVFQSVKAKSADGRINISVRPGSKMQEDWSVQSSEGDIRLLLPKSFSASLEASTLDGRIRNELPVTTEGISNESNLYGRLNGGGRKLRIRTSDGNIVLRSR